MLLHQIGHFAGVAFQCRSVGFDDDAAAVQQIKRVRRGFEQGLVALAVAFVLAFAAEQFRDVADGDKGVVVGLPAGPAQGHLNRKMPAVGAPVVAQRHMFAAFGKNRHDALGFRRQIGVTHIHQDLPGVAIKRAGVAVGR